MIYTKLKKKIAVAGAVVIAMSSAVVIPSIKNCTPVTTDAAIKIEHYHNIYTTTSTKSRVKCYITDEEAVRFHCCRKFYANGDYWVSLSPSGFMRSVDFNSMINHYYNRDKAATIPADVINALK